MSISVAALSQVSVASNSAILSSGVASGGTGPYTYQWYVSTTPGFTPGVGNIVTGATSQLNQLISNLIPNTTYYAKVVATDSLAATGTSAQLAFVTSAASQSPNSFLQSPTLGMIDLRFNTETVAVQIDLSQVGLLYPGSPVKMVSSADGIPKVIGCSANSDVCLGFINFDIKSQAFSPGDRCEISMAGNVMYLYATGAIARGSQVTLDILNNGVAQIVTSSGAQIVGWAYDLAAAQGSLIRVRLRTPSFSVA